MATFRDATLSKEVKARVLRGIEYDYSQRNEIFDKFIERFQNFESIDPENLKKFHFVLSKTSDKKKLKFNRGVLAKKLTLKNRRELGLYNLGRKSLKYRDLMPLHQLWKEYMIDYMKLSEIKDQNWKINPDDPNYDVIHQKLYRADYHGSEMTVTRSKCYSHVGKSGIVAMETKNCFKLLGKDDIVRTIPKATCAFKFNIDDFQFTFFGKNLLVKPAERSSKKIKTIYANDL